MAQSAKQHFSIPWENQDKSGLGGLSDDKKILVNTAVNRMNADFGYLQQLKHQNGFCAPKIYHEYAHEITESWKNRPGYSDIKNIKNTEVTLAEETFVLDREKARVYYEQNIAAQIYQPITRPLSKFKWDVRQHSIKKQEHAVKFSREFAEPTYIQLKISEQYDKGIGWYVGYQINRWQLLENQGELFDLQFETMLEASTQMARAANEHLFTGTTTIVGTRADDGEAGAGLAKTGFTNNASNQTHSTAALTTYLNIFKGIKAGLAKLKTVHASKNVIMIATAGIWDQMELNYPTYGHGDYDEYDHIARKLIGPNKPIKAAYSSDKLLGATPTLSTQAYILHVLDPRLMNRLVVFPLQTIPVLDKIYSDSISEIMIAGDILRYNVRADSNVNAFPASISASLTTTTLGYRSEERIL